MRSKKSKRSTKTQSFGVWSGAHFYGSALSSVYDKYKERGGRPVFHLNQTSEIPERLNQIFEIAGSSDYIRDMKINTLLCQLLEHLMAYSWNPENVTRSKKRLELDAVKSYLDMHYMEKITLEALADQYFIDKFYLSKIFKERYGMTVHFLCGGKADHRGETSPAFQQYEH